MLGGSVWDAPPNKGGVILTERLLPWVGGVGMRGGGKSGGGGVGTPFLCTLCWAVHPCAKLHHVMRPPVP